jgi:hypothetical protein
MDGESTNSADGGGCPWRRQIHDKQRCAGEYSIQDKDFFAHHVIIAFYESPISGLEHNAFLCVWRAHVTNKVRYKHPSAPSYCCA